METVNEFTQRLSNAVNCVWHSRKTRKSLKAYEQPPKGRSKNVFGWVKDEATTFRVSTYACLADDLGCSAADRVKEGGMFGEEDTLFFYIKADSSGPDFQKAVRTLKVVLANVKNWDLLRKQG